MKVIFEKEVNPLVLGQRLAELDADPAVQGILVLGCDENGYTPENVGDILKSVKKPLFGGLFPQILHDNAHHNSGFIALGLPNAPELAFLENISQPNADFEESLATTFQRETGNATHTMFVFVDGFSSRIGALIDGLFNVFGLEINYLGGGCGSLTLVQKPCVISRAGLTQDSAVIALMDLPSGVGVAHGWKPVSDTFKVTEVSGNVIHSLDWKPAFQVYRDVVESHSGKRFEGDNFFSLAKAYPFGMTKLGAEMVVRDPLMLKGDSLVCVGEVPKSTFVRILHGNQESLLAASRHALTLAQHDLADRQARVEIFIDCVSRVLFLEDEFIRELEGVKAADVPLIGALTIGEIANNGKDYLEFYNKTSVVGLL